MTTKKFDIQVESVQAIQATELGEVKKQFAYLADREDLHLDPDLMYAKFIMCHEGANANGDYFTNEVLSRAQYTPRNKPIDWEHGQPIIGTILDSRYSEDANGRGYIEAIGVIWKFIYPELAEQVKTKSSTGELRLSMECYFKDANYKYGDQVFDQEQAYQLGIADYVGREYMGQVVYRVFKDVVFGGVGVVANPADKEAVFLSVAKKQAEDIIESQNIVNNLELTDEQIKSIAEIIRNTNDFNVKQPNTETVSAVTIAKFVKAFDGAKSQIVSNLNKDEMISKDQLVSAVRSIIDSLLSEVSNITNDFYVGRASENSEEDEVFELNLKLEEHSEAIAQEEGGSEEMENINNEVVEEVVEQVEEVTEPVTVVTDEVDYQAKATELESKVATLVAELEAKASIEKELADLKAKVEASEKKALAESRIAELAELGVELSEARKAKELEKVSTMDEVAFADYKEFLSELVGKKEEVVEEAVAEVVEEEVVVEEVEEAQASLNIEIQEPKVIKPFSHLG